MPRWSRTRERLREPRVASAAAAIAESGVSGGKPALHFRAVQFRQRASRQPDQEALKRPLELVL